MSLDASPLLQLDGVTSGYGDLVVVRDVSVSFAQGSLVVLAGANGAGKTTLLRTIMGRLPLRSGRLLYEGTDIAGKDVRARALGGVAMVPQGKGLFPALTVAENLRVGARAAGVRGRSITGALDRAVGMFPVLRHRLSSKVSTLSGGQQQMVALARALVVKPRIILLDEPSVGLAPLVWREVLAACRALADGGCLVVIAEQKVHQALDGADVGLILQRGRLVREADAARLAGDGGLTSAYFGRSGTSIGTPVETARVGGNGSGS